MALRLAVVGCGKAAQRIALPQLQRCRNARVVALVDIDRAVARHAARQCGLNAPVWTDWRRMLREAEVDAVAVCVPNRFHAEVTIAALHAGKHVIVEKPMATTLADADAMVDAARARRRCLMVEQSQRFDPAHETAREILRCGLLGRVTQLRGRIGHAGPQYWAGTRATWLTDHRQAGGGALMDIGVHILDVLRWLSGKEVRRICCQAGTLEQRVPVEDNASAMMEFTDGTLGSFEASWTTRPYEVMTQWYAERGTLRTAFGAPHPVVVQRCRRRGDPNQLLAEDYPAVPAVSRHGSAYQHFVTCVLKGTPPIVSGEDGRATLAVILAAYASVRSGEWVNVPQRRA